MTTTIQPTKSLTPPPSDNQFEQLLREQKALRVEMEKYEWRGESMAGPISVRVYADGKTTLVIDTNRDGIYETQGVATPEGRMAVSANAYDANKTVYAVEPADALLFNATILDALADDKLTPEEMDGMAGQLLGLLSKAGASPKKGR